MSASVVQPVEQAVTQKIRVRGLNFYYGRFQALKNINLGISERKVTAFIGPSGCGKSTLLNLIAGLDRPDSGEVLLDGVVLSSLGDDEATLIRRKHMGFVFQAFHILPYLTVAQNVALPLVLNGVGDKAMDERVGALLDAVKLGDRGDSLPRELSGGEMQRVAIARALVHKPRLVFADEPTGNLDPDSAESDVDRNDSVDE